MKNLAAPVLRGTFPTRWPFWEADEGLPSASPHTDVLLVSSSRTHLAAILISAPHSCSCEQLKKVIFLYLKYRTH